MAKIDVKDYKMFDSITSQITNINNNLNGGLDEIQTVVDGIMDENTFLGPAAESSVNTLKSIGNMVTSIIDNYTDVSNNTAQINENYQNGNTQAANKYIATASGVHMNGVAKGKNTGKFKNLLLTRAADYENKANLGGSQLKFVNDIKQGAVDCYKKTGVLPSLTMAQAILETGWGKYRIGNNVFGVKAGSGWKGKTQTCQTKEQLANGKYVTINAKFRDYDSLSDSIVDHGEVLTQDRYKPVIAAKDYKEACKQVQACGYATSHQYANNLINIIEEYGLDQWDPK